MATITKWSNVAIAMQSALGADLTISGITLAAPGVVTSTAHGLVNGDYVVFDISNGMRQIHDKVYRVASKTNEQNSAPRQMARLADEPDFCRPRPAFDCYGTLLRPLITNG